LAVYSSVQLEGNTLTRKNTTRQKERQSKRLLVAQAVAAAVDGKLVEQANAPAVSRIVHEPLRFEQFLWRLRGRQRADDAGGWRSRDPTERR
jgi:hypothetical protein